MSNEIKQKGRFEPIHEAHAIEQVIFIIQFEKPIGEDIFNEVIGIAQQFSTELPGVADIQGYEFLIGTPGVVSPPPSGSSKGKIFRRVAPNGAIQDELRLERNSVTFRTLLYTRWEANWAQARKYFNVILVKYSDNVKLSGVGLNYVDKFAWIGNVSDCNPNLLLRESSKYLCPHIYSAKDLWHSHSGVFIRVGNNIKRLLNANVDYVDEHPPTGSRRAVIITTVMSDLINQPGYADTEVTSKNIVAFVESSMTQLHGYGKEVLGELINNEMCQRIALT